MLFFSNILNAKETNSLKLIRHNFFYENDVFEGTDQDYTSGDKFSLLFYNKKNQYFSFSLTNQMFTPKNKKIKNLITTDIPYAGWTFLEFGIHNSSKNILNSLNIKLGMVGSSSKTKELQNTVHKMIGRPKVEGWKNQIKNEPGLNITYQRKWRIIPKKILSFESNIIPFASSTIGNIHINSKAGILMRIGINPIKDFGSMPMNIASASGIPVKNISLYNKMNPFSFTLNFLLSGNMVIRNIFLDGNTFKKSYSVKKKRLIGYGSIGITLRYKHILLNIHHVMKTKTFNIERKRHNYDSFIFSYIF